ncbi:MAG: outer membrane beta-barrel protein [Henriciella sp.]
MKIQMILAGVAASAVLPAVAQESGFYGEAGLAVPVFDVAERDVSPVTVQARGGYMASEHFGFELEAATGIADAEESDGASSVSVEINHMIAGYAVARWPVNEKLGLVGRVGYQQIDVSIEGRSPGDPVFRQSGDGDGVVFGGGVTYDLGGFDMRADYTIAGEASPFPSSDKIGTFSLGLVKRF